MLNSNQGWQLPKELYGSIGREYGWPMIIETPATIDRRSAANLVGSYRDGAGIVLRIEQADEKLLLRVGDHDPIHLTASAGGAFFARLPRIEICFASTSEGTPTMILRQEGKTFEASRIPDDAAPRDGKP